MAKKFQPLALNTPAFERVEVREPELFRDQFPYSEVPRIVFDQKIVPLDPPDDIWITDTTFRDGQQARPPYAPHQIVDLYRLMHRLGGRKGVIRQCEFFVYSKRDLEAIEGCLALGYRYPEITGWIRARAEDFKLVQALELKETGILTSVSDYHIFLKLKKNRSKAMDSYLGVVKTALDAGLVPRCHFEDITRADIYGFCLPFAEELMKLSDDSGIPIKIRLCDTMGYGVTYPGAALPRSVPKLAHAFRRELGMPADRLEWHGHNDFHKVHINGTTAWMYGVSALNASLLGYGERCGNPPLEAAIMEYIALKGSPNGIDTTVITEIAEYFRHEVHAQIPRNAPFVGSQFNTTRAGIHADGLLKNPEIYNIFDTDKILKRPIMVSVTDKSGVAGIAHWLNQYAQKLSDSTVAPISKRHPGVRRIYEWVTEQYNQGRTTAISPAEILAEAKRHLPEFFESDFRKVKEQVIAKAEVLARRISAAPEIHSMDPEIMEPFLENVLRDEPFIQFLVVTDLEGQRLSQVHAPWGEKAPFRPLLRKNFDEHEWFIQVSKTDTPYYSEIYTSKYTHALTMTVAHPVLNNQNKMVAVVDVDFKFEELMKLLNNLPRDILEEEEKKQQEKKSENG